MNMFHNLIVKVLRLMNFVTGVGPDISVAVGLSLFIVLSSNLV